jgi:hypothetical protein
MRRYACKKIMQMNWLPGQLPPVKKATNSKIAIDF